MKMSNIIGGLAILYALAGQPAQAGTTDTVSTKNTQRTLCTETKTVPERVPLHMTAVTIDNYVLKHQFTSRPEGHVAAFFANNIVKSEHANMGGAVMSVGAMDGRDESFIDVWGRTDHDGASYGLEAGQGVRKYGNPRWFAIATAEKVHVVKDIKTSIEAAVLTKDNVAGESGNNYYGWLAVHNPHLYIAGGYDKNNTQLFTNVTGMKDFGSFAWLKSGKSGSWSLKMRNSAGNVDERFYSTEMGITATRLFTIPAFFETHLTPSQTKGDYTLGIDLTKDNGKDMAYRIVPGAKTPAGNIGLGIESTSAHDIGLYASYYNKFNMLGVNGSIEVNYNAPQKDLNGYVTLSTELGK